MAGILDLFGGGSEGGDGWLNTGFSNALSNPLFVAGLSMMGTRKGQESEALQNAMKMAMAAQGMGNDRKAMKAMSDTIAGTPGGIPGIGGGNSASISGTTPPLALPQAMPPPKDASGVTGDYLRTVNAPKPIAPVVPAAPVQMAQATTSRTTGDAMPSNGMLGSMPEAYRRNLPQMLASEKTRPFALKLIEQYSDPKLSGAMRKQELDIQEAETKLGGNMPTDVQSNYNRAVKQGYTGTLLDYQKEIRSQINNTATISGETEHNKTLGKAQAERHIAVQKEGQTASQQLGTLRLMEQQIGKPEFYSGFGGQTAQTANRALVALGVKDPKAASASEVFSSLSNQTVMDGLGGSLGTGISNADRSFIKEIVPNIENTPAGNKDLINIRRQLAERQIVIAKMAREYAKGNGGRLDDGFDEQLAQFAEANPLFKQDNPPPAAGDRITREKTGMTPPPPPGFRLVR